MIESPEITTPPSPADTENTPVPGTPSAAVERRSVLTLRQLGVMLGLLCGLTVMTVLACSIIGVIPIQHLTLDIWKLRLIRLAMAALIGAGLSVSGLALQGMLRNPLADPYILGVSSGAGLGVLIGLSVEGTSLALLPPWATTPVLALVGALATCAIVYAIAQRRGRLDPYVLLLSGVIVNAFNGAIALAIYLFIKPHVIDRFIYWSMGSLTYTVGGDSGLETTLYVSAACVIVGWSVLVLRGNAFNALGLGDDVAASSGVPVHYLRVETFFVVGLMTASAVALAGPIGFVGLIVPHICRLIVGPDHRPLSIVSGFVGAMFLMVADTFCRTAGDWFNLSDIPVGIITAMCGGPFFIYLLRRRSGGGSR